MTTPCPTLGTLLLERMLIRLITEGGKGGSRSRFTENKTVLSQFTKNNAMIKNGESCEFPQRRQERRTTAPLCTFKF